MSIRRILAMSAIAALFAVSPAIAQKSENVLRIAATSVTVKVDPYLAPGIAAEDIARAVFDTLIMFNEQTGTYEPLLAKSYDRIGPTTLEFKLRQDVVWQDGELFDADDVVYTINWLTDPAVKLQFKHKWEWIKQVEKIDQFTVRIIAKTPTPIDVMLLAYDTPIFPQHIHGMLTDKENFGKNPIGTGPYRVESIDINKGIMLIQNERYYANTAKTKTNIKKVYLLPLEEMSTQVAKLMVGDVDIIQNVEETQASELTAGPRFTATYAPTWASYYIMIDARGRSGEKALLNKQVRKAIMMAMDRNGFLKIQIGDKKLNDDNELKSICYKIQAGCGYSESLPAYNPDGARTLLAEAGYNNNLKITVTGVTQNAKKYVELVAGYLREVGVEASVNIVTPGVSLKERAQGKIQLFVSIMRGVDRPDVYGLLSAAFAPGKNDFFGDTYIHQLLAQSEIEIDDTVRREIVGKLVDRAIQESYISILVPRMTSVVHTKDVIIGQMSGVLPGFSINDINWK